LTDELKHSNAELKQFAYAASHDLQEPLRNIAGFVKLLEKRYKGKFDEKADEYFEYVTDGVIRMQALIKDLLEYSRVGTRGKAFTPENCTQAVEQALSNLRSTVENTGSKITCDTLPVVMADVSQLSRLFQNLIGNAMKFCNRKPPKVHISAKQKGDDWVFSVKDNGIGIDPKHFERIFAIFQRLHTREEYEGTGIGLSLCKKIVERHGGRIWVESAVGKGATFFFTIPAGH
jgi:light-regulated signal transduction histidine kinase (bacteriophytochrome)